MLRNVTAHQFSAPTDAVGDASPVVDVVEARVLAAEQPQSALGALLAEYKASLKAIEAEELLDLVLYRPLAFLLTRVVQNTRISPNQISVASLFFGLLAGWLFWVGSPAAGVLAAASYFACNVLDCADGQLARVRGTSSPFGFAVDGSIDYLASTAVFVGMAHNLAVQRPGHWNWYWISTAAGLLYAWQCAILDRKRHEWMHIVHGRRRDTQKEIEWMKEHFERYRRERSHAFERLLILIYLTYMGVWTRLTPHNAQADRAMPPRELWAECNRPVLKLALAAGPTTQMTAIMLAGLFNRADVYLWATLLLGNLYALFVIGVQWRASRKLQALLVVDNEG